jgi:hypothetical protein
MKNHKMKKLLDMLMSDVVGGSINSDACEIHKEYMVIHCWDGRRYILARQRDGCKYDTRGKPISRKK